MTERKGWRRALRIAGTFYVWAMGLVLFLFLAMYGLVPMALLESVGRLFFGWVLFLGRNLGEMVFDPARILVGLGGAILAGAVLHLLASRWRRWARPQGMPWRRSWTAALVLVFFAFALAAMSVAGIGHQVAWLGGERLVAMPRSEVIDRNNARQLLLAALFFAEEHEGRFPDGTEELEEGLGGVDPETRAALFLFRGDGSGTPEPWLYFGAGRQEDPDAEPFPILASPRSSKEGRIVGFSDGRVRHVAEADFRVMMDAAAADLR